LGGTNGRYIAISLPFSSDNNATLMAMELPFIPSTRDHVDPHSHRIDVWWLSEHSRGKRVSMEPVFISVHFSR
jgi:hypothetical protein